MDVWGSVFVSHTSELAGYPPPPLRSFVQAAVDAVLKAQATPVDMAYFAAREGKPAAYCEQQVRHCDVYVGLVGFRYGSLVPDRDDGVSYTDLEFRTATAAGIPRLVFLVDEDAPIPPRLVDEDRAAVTAFRDRLRRAGVIVKTVGAPDALETAVLHALHEVQADWRRRSPRMAPPPDDRIVERDELGEKLLAALLTPGAREVGMTTGLHGAGGFGKTWLAAWACHHPQVKERYPGGALWATIGQEVHGAQLADRVNDLSYALCGRRPAISDPEAAGAELGRLLDDSDGGGPILLVVDDVWEEAQLRPFRYGGYGRTSAGGGGREVTRLVTTRLPGLLPRQTRTVRVDAMTPEQARDLASYDVQGLPGESAARLAALTGCWPVLLNLVNGTLAARIKRGQPADQAAHEIILRLVANGPTAFDPKRPGERRQAVAATVGASLDLLDRDDIERYLDLAVFPKDTAIPVDVLELLWPGTRTDVDELCDQLDRLGLVADYRLDAPGPRVRLHEVMCSYLHRRRTPAEHADVHARLVEAARALCSGPGNTDGRARGGTAWWALPTHAAYLWRHLPYHLDGAGRGDELAALVIDLRWVEASTAWFDSTVQAEAGLALAGTSTAATLARALAQAGHLLAPLDGIPGAAGATLASRLDGIPGLEQTVAAYRAHLPQPRLDPRWPLPDRPDPAHLRTLASQSAAWVSGVAFSPDGALLATASADSTVRVWETASGTARATLTGHSDYVWAVAFSPDGTLLASAGADATVQLWNVATGTACAALTGHTSRVNKVVFSPDGTLLATASDDQTVRVWDVATGIARVTLTGHTGTVDGVAFSPDGTLLASAGADATVRLWEVADGTTRANLTGHAGRVWGVTFSPDGTLLASAGADATVRLWEVADGTTRATLTGHTGWVWDVAFSPDSTLLASAGDDATVRLWEVPGGSMRTALTGHTSRVWGVAFSPDGTLLVSASDDVRVWEVPSGATRTALTGHTSRVSGVAFSPDGTLLASAGADAMVRLWEVADGTTRATLTGHTSRVNAVAFSPDGTLLAAASDDVRVWEVASGTMRAALTGHPGRVRGVAFSPNGALLATAAGDGVVRVWEVASGTVRAALTHAGRMWGVAFSPDGALLASVGDDGLVRVWDIASGTVRATLAGHTGWVRRVTFSPDGALLASTGDDGLVRVWNIAGGTVQATLAGHTGWVWGAAFSPEGTLLATASNDATVRVWEVASSPEGILLATASSVATMRAWEAVPGTPRAALRVDAPLIDCAWHPHKPMIGLAGNAGVYLLDYRA